MFPPTLAVPPPPRAADPLDSRSDASSAELQFLSAFERIAKTSSECGYHADVLSWAAARQYRHRRNTNFAAGLLALLSSAAVAAVVSGLATESPVRLFAVMAALAAGLVCLVNTHLRDDGETEQLLNGAAEFRAVQKLAEMFRDRPLFIELETRSKLAAAGVRRRASADAQSSPAQDQKQPTLSFSDQQEREFKLGAERAFEDLSELRQRQSGTSAYRSHLEALIAANERAYVRKRPARSLVP
jgi:hypothetical protein